MNLSHDGEPADTTTHRNPTRPRGRNARRLARLAMYGLLTGAATAIGKAATTAALWWWTHTW